MLLTWLSFTITGFFCSYFIFRIGIKNAGKFNLLDYPSPRKRHRGPMPIVGGVCIFLAWVINFLFFSSLHLDWLKEQLPSLIPLAFSLCILIGVGLLDDVKGLNPRPKLFFQFIAAAIMICFEPRLHDLCLYWQNIAGFVIWPVILLWIVGITNSINLIDGLDGLAGGTSLIVCLSIVVLCYFTHSSYSLQSIVMFTLIGPVAGFLKYNWNPAKVFLGDNGSLPLGFLIAWSSITCHPPQHSSVMIASIVLMLGYPMLDMGLAVYRRARNQLPLFKADRNHLHFRLQRLGLTTSQTAIFLLAIGLYLQITALCLNLLPVPLILASFSVITFSVFSMIYLIRCIELSRVRRMADSLGFARTKLELVQNEKELMPDDRACISISLDPIFESGMLEEKVRYGQVISSLEAMLKASAAIDEEVHFKNRLIKIILSNSNAGDIIFREKEIRLKYEVKLAQFCAMFNVQCSMSTFPLIIEK